MSFYRTLSLLTLGACVAGSSLLLAQNEPAARKETRGPLPANYGKLGLSDEQREKLYPIHEEYQAKIDALSAQIKQLQNERNAKFREHLTAGQKERLKELAAEDAAKRAAAAKKLEAAKPAEAPATTTEKK